MVVVAAMAVVAVMVVVGVESIILVMRVIIIGVIMVMIMVVVVVVLHVVEHVEHHPISQDSICDLTQAGNFLIFSSYSIDCAYSHIKEVRVFAGQLIDGIQLGITTPGSKVNDCCF